MANVVYTGFDPAFQDRLNQLTTRAKAEGYTPSLISGVRAAYAWPGMKGQSQADLYSQLGKPGGPRAAAPPGYSPHQYGVAGDVTGIPQSELERLAPLVGLRAIHSDPNHIELANWQQEAAAQPPRTAWDQSAPANVPSQYASNISAGNQPAGGGFAIPPANSFLSSLSQIESGNRNIFSGVDKDYPGQPGSRSQGFYQIDTPTWQQFAAKAGVDVSKFPSAMNAPQEVQAQVASLIPLSRFGPRTRSMLQQQYGKFDTGQTVGQLSQQFGQGTTLTTNPITNPGPMDPSAQARGSTVNPLPPGAAPAPELNPFQKLFTRPEPTKDAQGNDVQGKSPIEKLAGDLGGVAKAGGQQQAAAPQPAQFAPVQDPMAAMAPAAAQLYSTVQAQAAKPLSWSSRPYGWDAGLQMTPGMSLNTTGYG